MYVDMVNQPDLRKYDLSSLEGGKKIKNFLFRIIDLYLIVFVIWMCLTLVSHRHHGGLPVSTWACEESCVWNGCQRDNGE